MNFGWLAVDRTARMLVSVVVGLWVARYLGPADFGRLNFALASVALLVPLAELGLESVLRREFIRCPEQASELAATAMLVRAVGGIIALIVVGLLVVLSLGSMASAERGLVVVLALTLFQPAFMVPDAWLQSRLQARTSVKATWVALAAGTIARAGAVLGEADLGTFAWIVVAEQTVSALTVGAAARTAGFSVTKPVFLIVGRLLKECWPLALSSVFVVVYMRIDVLMLRALAGEYEAGQYAAAVRLSELPYVLPLIAAASIQPVLLREHQNQRSLYLRHMQMYFDLSALLACLWALPVCFLSPWLVAAAYGPQFAVAAPMLRIQVWASVFVFLGVARSQFLINEGLTGFALGCTVAGACFNVLLNLALIPLWGGEGAASATVASYGIAAWLSSFASSRTRNAAIMQSRALLIPVTFRRVICAK